MEKDGIYTMEQFKEMYDDAVVKTLEELDKKWHEELDKKWHEESMSSLIFSLHNVLAFQELKKEIFKDE